MKRTRNTIFAITYHQNKIKYNLFNDLSNT